jgi:hypothetical protein
MTSPERTHVATVISDDLVTRASAADLLEMIEKLPGDVVEVDFDGVKSCTRSFADEYHVRKLSSSKTIREINMPTSVYQLLMAVAHPRKKDQVIDIENLKVTVL